MTKLNLAVILGLFYFLVLESTISSNHIKTMNNAEELILDCPKPISVRGGLFPFFDWSDVSGATGYHLQVSLFPLFNINIIDVIVENSQYQSIVPLLPLRVYNWRVSTCDSYSFGGFCWVSIFETGN